LNQVNEKVVSQILSKIYRDTLVYQSQNYFIKHTYTASQFASIVDVISFHNIIGFLPNTKYRGNQFIMSVVYDKSNKNYEVTVKNQNLNA
jgi:hypothetical protein